MLCLYLVQETIEVKPNEVYTLGHGIEMKKNEVYEFTKNKEQKTGDTGSGEKPTMEYDYIDWDVIAEFCVTAKLFSHNCNIF